MTRHVESVVAQFLSSGNAPDRETVEGWNQWRTTRHLFQAAPVIDLDTYRRMSARNRQLHDLHRAATHVNLPMQETPMSAAIAEVMKARLQNNAFKRKPVTLAGLMITGGGYQGKTETACEIAAEFEDLWLRLMSYCNPDAMPGTRDLHASVAYVQTPVTAKPKSLCEAILNFYGAPHSKMNLPQMTQLVKTSLRDHGTRVLLLDDITRLKMRRVDDQDTLDLIRALMSITTLVLIGVDIPRSGLLREAHRDPINGQWIFPPPASELGDDLETQTERRFDLLHLQPFRYDTPAAINAWVAHLAGIEENLRLFAAERGMLTAGTMPEYLFRRTNGVIGLLERLVEDGCTKAISTGAEKLTEDLLDEAVISLGDWADRRTDDEIPDIPAPSKPRRRKRGRNTVFDDRGLPSSTAVGG